MTLIKLSDYISSDTTFPNKISALSSLVETALEEVLNQLISNNFKPADIASLDLFDNKIEKLNKLINEMSLNIISNLRIGAGYKILNRKTVINNNSGKILKNTLGYLIFSNTMQNIYNDIVLIRYNINEPYKYPALLRLK